jgi:hypothetical protein
MEMMRMMKSRILFMTLTLTLFLVSGTGLSTPVYSQLGSPMIDNNSLSEQQRIGTNNILNFPDVNLLYGNGKNASLDLEFILLGNNPSIPNQHNVAIANPDYSLSIPIPTLMVGENITINSTTDEDIKYSSALVVLVPITSPFPPTNMNIEDVDPESDLALSTPINFGTYGSNYGSLVIPPTVSPGSYLFYAYLQYPTYNMTAVYNTAVQVTHQ